MLQLSPQEPSPLLLLSLFPLPLLRIAAAMTVIVFVAVLNIKLELYPNIEDGYSCNWVVATGRVGNSPAPPGSHA